MKRMKGQVRRNKRQPRGGGEGGKARTKAKVSGGNNNSRKIGGKGNRSSERRAKRK